MLNPKYFDSFPRLTTPRLELRPLAITDADLVYRLRSSATVARFIERPLMEKLSDSEQLIKRTLQSYHKQQSLAWTGVLRHRGLPIGTCGLNHIDHQNLRAEIGGELLPDYWGKGIAEEAFRTIVDFGLAQLGLHAIEARVMAGNRGAVYLLKQLNFVREGYLKEYVNTQDGWQDLLLFTKLAPPKQ